MLAKPVIFSINFNKMSIEKTRRHSAWTMCTQDSDESLSATEISII